jgi:uncharacterized membrane protein
MKLKRQEKIMNRLGGFFFGIGATWSVGTFFGLIVPWLDAVDRFNAAHWKFQGGSHAYGLADTICGVLPMFVGIALMAIVEERENNRKIAKSEEN